MNSCTLGFHKWAYTSDGNSRWCTQCHKKQEKAIAGKWGDSNRSKKTVVVDETKYCECPRDYTISIRTMTCQRCGLPRRPRVLPSGGGDASRSR